MFISNLWSLERRGNHSLTSKCRFKNPKIHDLCCALEYKTRAKGVFVSLIPGRSGQGIQELNRNG